MPFTSIDDDLMTLRTPLGREAEPGPRRIVLPESPLAAAWRTQNVIGSILAAGKPAGSPRVEGYTAADDPQFRGTKYEQEFPDYFVGSDSPGETTARMRQVDREEKDKRLIEDAGWAGTIANVAMGVADPTIFLPGGSLVRGARGISRLATMASWAGIGAGTIAAQEGVFQATQATRTPEESYETIGVATILSPVNMAAHSSDPMVQELGELVSNGDISRARDLAAAHALERISDIEARVRKAGSPRDAFYFPCYGDCLGPSLASGSITVVDQQNGVLLPGGLAVLSEEGGYGLTMVKVYLGLIDHADLPRIVDTPPCGPGLYAVFWCEKPEGVMAVCLQQLRFLAPVAGIIDLEGTYFKGEWAFDDHQVPFLADVVPFLEPVPLESFGEPPLATRAAA